MNRDVGPAARLQHAAELEHPGVGHVVDVREHRAGVDQVEIVVGKRQVGRRGGDAKVKRRAQILLAPEDMLAADVGAPNLSFVGDVFQAAEHAGPGDAQFQHAISRFDLVAGRGQQFAHLGDVPTARFEPLFDRPAVAEPEMFGRVGQLSRRRGAAWPSEPSTCTTCACTERT